MGRTCDQRWQVCALVRPSIFGRPNDRSGPLDAGVWRRVRERCRRESRTSWRFGLVNAGIAGGLWLVAGFIAIGMDGDIWSVLMPGIYASIATCIAMAAFRTPWFEPAYSVAKALVAEGYCAQCGYRIAEIAPEADQCRVCPECGAAWRVPSAPG